MTMAATTRVNRIFLFPALTAHLCLLVNFPFQNDNQNGTLWSAFSHSSPIYFFLSHFQFQFLLPKGKLKIVLIVWSEGLELYLFRHFSCLGVRTNDLSSFHLGIFEQNVPKQEETALQSSCRYMATQHHNLSIARIDLNALILQRREAVEIRYVPLYLYHKKRSGLHLWYENDTMHVHKAQNIIYVE